jgi:hypothetical protein
MKMIQKWRHVGPHVSLHWQWSILQGSPKNVPTKNDKVYIIFRSLPCVVNPTRHCIHSLLNQNLTITLKLTMLLLQLSGWMSTNFQPWIMDLQDKWGHFLDCPVYLTLKTEADDIICSHFRKNKGVYPKVFEEKLFILTFWTMILHIFLKHVAKFSIPICVPTAPTFSY